MHVITITDPAGNAVEIKAKYTELKAEALEHDDPVKVTVTWDNNKLVKDTDGANAVHGSWPGMGTLTIDRGAEQDESKKKEEGARQGPPVSGQIFSGTICCVSHLEKSVEIVAASEAPVDGDSDCDKPGPSIPEGEIPEPVPGEPVPGEPVPGEPVPGDNEDGETPDPEAPQVPGDGGDTSTEPGDSEDSGTPDDGVSDRH